MNVRSVVGGKPLQSSGRLLSGGPVTAITVRFGGICLNGSAGRTRTFGTVINSHLLYQLSYRGILLSQSNRKKSSSGLLLSWMYHQATSFTILLPSNCFLRRIRCCAVSTQMMSFVTRESLPSKEAAST